MARPDHCPHCGVSLTGNPIPERDQPLFNRLDGKPSDPDWATHFRREIGVEVPGIYDGILYYKCPDCGGMWNRWPDKPDFVSLWRLAEREMEKERKRREQA